MKDTTKKKAKTFGAMAGIGLGIAGDFVIEDVVDCVLPPAVKPAVKVIQFIGKKAIGLGTTYAVSHAVSEMTDEVIDAIEKAEELAEEKNNQPKKEKVNKGNTIKERRAFRKAQKITKGLATE